MLDLAWAHLPVRGEGQLDLAAVMLSPKASEKALA